MSPLLAPAIDPGFIGIFNRLCVALREPVDDSGITAAVYAEALADVSLAALDAGARALMRERGRKFFPTTAEWRTAAEAAQTASLQATLTHRDEDWHLECEACEDTGWVAGLTCDGGAEVWPEQLPPHPTQTRGARRGTHTAGRAWTFTAEPRATPAPQPATCGRTRPHLPHSWTRACPCRATNRTYQRHQLGGR